MFDNNKKNSPSPADEITLQNLRTYEDDVKNAIQTDNISTTKIMLAEQKKREAKEIENKKNTPVNKKPINPGAKRNSLIAFLAVVLLLVGSFLIYYNFNYIKPYFQRLGLEKRDSSSGVLVANQKIEINSVGRTKGEIVNEIEIIIADATRRGSKDEVVELSILKKAESNIVAVGNKDLVKINTVDFFSLINSRAPESLIRSLSEEVVFGYHKSNTAEPFIIFKTTDINQTYSGLIAWENNMGTDLKKIFSVSLKTPEPENTPRPVSDIENGNDGNDSNENIEILAEQVPTFDIRKFTDLIILNKDTRAIIDSYGKILFFYSIVDNEHVIMTTNKNTLDTILNRINQVKLVR